MKKRKQTAEISWLFIWDVKILKNFVKQSFDIFDPNVRSYIGLCSPTTQQPKTSYQYPCFVIHLYTLTKKFEPAIFWYFVKNMSFLNFMKKKSNLNYMASIQNLKKLQNKCKLTKFLLQHWSKSLVWQIIGICCTSLHNTHELSVHLCFAIVSSFPMCFWTFLVKRLFLQ